MVEIDADRIQHLDLSALGHHMDQPAFARGRTCQRGRAAQRIQIFGDRGGFGDIGAVRQFQHRQCAGIILGQKLGHLMLALTQIDLHEFHQIAHVLLGQRDAHPRRIGPCVKIMQFQPPGLGPLLRLIAHPVPSHIILAGNRAPRAASHKHRARTGPPPRTHRKPREVRRFAGQSSVSGRPDQACRVSVDEKNIAWLTAERTCASV